MKDSTKKLILTIASCVGVVATSVATIFGTKKAMKKTAGKELTKKETAKVTWTCYIPTVVCGATTIAAIIFNNKLSAAQMSAVLSSAGISAKLLNEYEHKTRELLGDDKFEEIRASIAKDHEDGVVYALVPTIESDSICSVYDDIDCGGDELFYDIWNDTWFRSSMSAVRMAEYHLNRNYAIGGCVSVAEFYKFLGIPFGEKEGTVGWGLKFREDGMFWVDFQHQKNIKEDTGEEYTIIAYDYAPEPFTEEDEWDIQHYSYSVEALPL